MSHKTIILTLWICYLTCKIREYTICIQNNEWDGLYKISNSALKTVMSDQVLIPFIIIWVVYLQYHIDHSNKNSTL